MEIIVKGMNHSCALRLLRHVTKAIVFAVAWTNCAAWAQTVPADLVVRSVFPKKKRRIARRAAAQTDTLTSNPEPRS